MWINIDGELLLFGSGGITRVDVDYEGRVQGFTAFGPRNLKISIDKLTEILNAKTHTNVLIRQEETNDKEKQGSIGTDSGECVRGECGCDCSISPREAFTGSN